MIREPCRLSVFRFLILQTGFTYDCKQILINKIDIFYKNILHTDDLYNVYLSINIIWLSK